MGRGESHSPVRDKKDGKKEKRKHKSKDKEKDREKERDRDKEEDFYQEYEYKIKENKDKDKDRLKDRDKDKDRRDRDKDKERKERVRDKDKERDKDRDRDKRLHRDYDKDRDRHRDYEKDRDYYREHDRDRDRDRHKPRRDEEDRSKRRDKRSRSKSPEQDDDHKNRKKRSAEQQKPSQEDLEKQRKEAEQAALEDEMERRRKRVEEWQRKRTLEQQHQELLGLAKKEQGEDQNAKGWSLEDDDDDDDEDGPQGDAERAEAAENGVDTVMTDVKEEPGVKAEMKEEECAEEEVDPLEAYMLGVVQPEVQHPSAAASAAATTSMDVDVKQEEVNQEDVKQGDEGKSKAAVAGNKRSKAVRFESSSSGSEEESEEEDSAEEDDQEWIKGVTSGRLSKGDKLGQVDHATINYMPFKKKFYIEVPELQRMSEAEVKALQKELDGIKVRGKNVPKPIRSWTHAGLSGTILQTLKGFGFSAPLPIQAQALPTIMSGRDCIGIAKTGSGKTLAFVLPMLRHIMAQPPLQIGDGPVGLIMAPTRELVQQIGKEVKKFAKPLNMRCVCAFGGAGIGNQISELKRGAEVVACTPGRMIDLLVTSNGKITNLRRVTFLVLDEADRMFDMGFEPQIMRIVHNIRPDKQTVMFSATFPKQVEALAKDVLDSPVEILVGGRSVVNSDITQFVEIRPEQERYLRLLEILGEWYEKGKIIIFVQSQDKCDTLFRDLLKSSYPCLSLHGGKDQSDRESTVADFKNNVCNILIATSIAARGLDVKDLVLVVNYDVPNHHEDYVHRVGRTGRAGNKGTAISFIGPDEQRYAPDLVKALKESGVPVPQDLQDLADVFHEARKRGEVQAHGSGYGGSGFKFDAIEEDTARQQRRAKAKELGLVGSDDESQSDDEQGAIKAVKPQDPAEAVQAAVQAAAAAAAAAGATPGVAGNPGLAAVALDKVAQAHQLAAKLAAGGGAAGAPVAASAPISGIVRVAPLAPLVAPAMPPVSAAVNPIVAAAQAAASQLAAKHGVAVPVQQSQAGTGMVGAARAAALAAAWGGGGISVEQVPAAHYEAELEINDFPQHARWKVTHRDSIGHIQDLTGAAVTTRGTFVAPGRPVPAGERKLFLLIEGTTELSVKRAKQEIKKILEETTEKVMRRDAPAGGSGKYSVM